MSNIGPYRWIEGKSEPAPVGEFVVMHYSCGCVYGVPIISSNPHGPFKCPDHPAAESWGGPVYRDGQLAGHCDHAGPRGEAGQAGAQVLQ